MNMMRTITSRLALALSLTSLSAWGQRDPFADYESRGGTTPASELEADVVEAEEAEPPPPPAAATPSPVSQTVAGAAPLLKLDQGTWSFRGTTMFGYNGTTNELLDGTKQTNNTMFLRLAPGVGYHVIDKLEVSGSVGYLGRSLGRDGGDRSTASDVLTEVRATYALPFASSTAFMPGIGAGMYFGGSSRTLRVDEGGQSIDVKEGTKTVGAALGLYAMLKYQIGSQWGLTGGLALNALFGSEKIESADERLGSNSVYIGLPVEIHYSF